MEKNKSIFETLSVIDVNEHTEKKNKLTYLSWTWAWTYVKKHFPDASYEVINFNDKPYLFDENLGYMVKTCVTIDGESLTMHLPVMDGANKAQKDKPYTYEVKEYKNSMPTGKMLAKTVEAATMFDINTAIMRCLVKNIALFGLGIYIYAGEDYPLADKDSGVSQSATPVRVMNNTITKEPVAINPKTAKQEAIGAGELKSRVEANFVFGFTRPIYSTNLSGEQSKVSYDYYEVKNFKIVFENGKKLWNELKTKYSKVKTAPQMVYENKKVYAAMEVIEEFQAIIDNAIKEKENIILLNNEHDYEMEQRMRALDDEQVYY